jgi:hypothetical protein
VTGVRIAPVSNSEAFVTPRGVRRRGVHRIALKERTIRKEYAMSRPIAAAVVVASFFIAATTLQSAQQYPAIDAIAQKVIQKYQGASCADLLAKKGQPPTQQQSEAVQMLRENPGMRQAFLDKVAPTIVNKMFECGMIP